MFDYEGSEMSGGPGRELSYSERSEAVQATEERHHEGFSESGAGSTELSRPKWDKRKHTDTGLSPTHTQTPKYHRQPQCSQRQPCFILDGIHLLGFGSSVMSRGVHELGSEDSEMSRGPDLGHEVLRKERVSTSY